MRREAKGHGQVEKAVPEWTMVANKSLSRSAAMSMTPMAVTASEALRIEDG